MTANSQSGEGGCVRRIAIIFVIILVLSLSAQAQDDGLSVGDAPRAEKITLAGNENGTVTITGEAGSVYTPSQIVVRNLHTGEVVFDAPSFDGSFETTMAGTPAAPFQINVAPSFPPDERDTYTNFPGTGTLIQQRPNPTIFTVAGDLAYGASRWFAEGDINRFAANAGDDLIVRMDFTMTLPDAALSLPYTMRGELALRPFTDAAGRQINVRDDLQRGWSSALTEAGIPIWESLAPDIVIAEATTTALGIDETARTLRFSLDLVGNLPPGIADGFYIPIFRGSAAVGDSAAFDWYDNRIFSTVGAGAVGTSTTRLPVVLRVGAVPEVRGVWAVMDALAAEDRTRAELTDLIQHTPSLTIRPPGDYALAPRPLPYGEIVPPVPFSLPGGALQAAITRPDGVVETLATDAPLRQYVIEDGQVRLSPLTDDFTYTFDVYGEYVIELRGVLLDIFGNRHVGGGTYRITIAEPLTLSPAALPGAPFVVGDAVPVDVTLAPALPADVLLDVRGVLGGTVQGQASRYGVFHAESPLRWGQAGAYVLDYTARYVDDTGRWWAGSLRSAGVVADGQRVIFGRRGLADEAPTAAAQAWFDTAIYPDDAFDIAPVVNYPHFPGDVAFVPDRAEAGIRPALEADSPLLFSVVRPDVRVREAAVASPVDMRFGNDDRLGEQVGAGLAGHAPGDILFLFGGDLGAPAGYAAAAIITEETDTARVVPPFRAPLLRLDDEPVALFIVPMALRPGQVVVEGAARAVAGHLVPPLPADVRLRVTKPGSLPTEVAVQANPYGHFALDGDVLFDQVGVWRVGLEAEFRGQTSAGQVVQPYPQGGILGASEDDVYVFVVPADAPQLSIRSETDSTVFPGQSITIVAEVPPGWTQVQAFVTARTATYVLQQGTLDVVGSTVTYRYDWNRLARRIPNLEADGAGDEAAASDEVTITLALTGVAADGSPTATARVFTLRHNVLVAGR